MATWLVDFPENIQTTLMDPLNSPLSELILNLTDSSVPGTLPHAFATLGLNLLTWLDGLDEQITESFVLPITTGATDAINAVIGDEDSLKSSFLAFFAGAEEGSIAWMLSQATSFFSNWALNAVPDALRSFGTSVWGAIAVPMIDMLNWLIIQLTTWLDELLPPGLETFLQTIIPGFTAPEMGDPFQISRAAPGFLTGARKGGLFTAGMLQVGESGPEVVGSSDKMAVFPNEFVTAVNHLSNVLVSAFSSSNTVGAGGSSVINDSSTSNSSTTINFPQQSGTDDAVRRLSLMGLFS